MPTSTIESEKAKKVLIIEDEGDMCLLLNILLSGKNLELDHVKSLSAAAEYLEKARPALVLIDNKLPDGFGIDFLSAIKQKYSDTRIIMISGFDAAAKDVAIENGADVFLQKPFTRETIYAAVNNLILSNTN